MPVFQASGLASGLDTLSIIDALADAQRAPIRQLQRKQEAYNIQLSALANLRSAVEEFKNASEALKTSGVVGNTATENSSEFTVETTPDASAGNYQLGVAELATPPKWRTDLSSFTSKTDVVKAGTLTLALEGSSYEITVEEGDTLEDVAKAINASNAAVDASVVETGTGKAFLTIVGKNTGFRTGSANPYYQDGDAQTDWRQDALQISWSGTGASGTDLTAGAPVNTYAKNASFSIDGVLFSRRTNTFSDAIPGVKITLDGVGRYTDADGRSMPVPDFGSEDFTTDLFDPNALSTGNLLLNQSPTATQENMQRWVDAYNGINSLLQADLNVQAAQDRTRGLTGDPSIKSLQRQLRELIIEEIPSLGNSVRTLADIGLKTGNDGSLSFDTTALERALKKDPSAVNGIFQAADGITENIETLVNRQLATNDGTFDVKRKSLEKAIREIQDQVLDKEAQIEKFKESMTMRFTAMEQSVGASKSMGDYLKNVKFPGFSKES